MVGDALAQRWEMPRFHRSGPALVTHGSVAGLTVLLVKPQTYMNLSGRAIRPLLREPGFAPDSDLLVLVDDKALPLGSFRLRAQGSAGGHRGLESVEEALGSRDYARLRIGVGPLPDDVDDWSDFVLAPFRPDELTVIEDLLPTLGEAVECWLDEGIHTAMNRFNRRGIAE